MSKIYKGTKTLHLNDDRKWIDLKDGEVVPSHLVEQAERKVTKIDGRLEDADQSETKQGSTIIPNLQTEVEAKPKKEKKKEFAVQDLPGVGAATAEKLKEAGFDTLLSIAVASPAELVEIAGATEATARKIIQAARANLNMGFESGIDLLEKRNNVTRISTGSKAVDAMLGGGVETGAITECFGAYGSGKTSIGHQLMVNVQLPKDQGGAEGAVAVIDTEGTLRPEFVKQLAEAKGLDPEKVLQNVKGVRALNSDHQMLLVEKVEELIKQGVPIKLIVVDSLMGHFRSEFIGRGQLSDRQQKLNKHMHALLKLANTYDVAIYLTNQVMSKPDTFFGDPTEAIGGHIVAHNSTYRIYLRRGKKGTRVAKLVDAPARPDCESVFMITGEGIKDV